MTLEEAVRQIDQAAEEKLTKLDLSGLVLEVLPQQIGQLPEFLWDGGNLIVNKVKYF